jgi:hypothetical protein
LTLGSLARDDVSSRLLISADRQVNHSYLLRSSDMSKSLTIIALVLSLLAFVYSLLGIAMAYWVVAVPGNTPEHIRLNFLVWVPASIITLALSVFLVFRLATRSSR